MAYSPSLLFRLRGLPPAGAGLAQHTLTDDNEYLDVQSTITRNAHYIIQSFAAVHA
jgi:hypothetical protein